MKKIYLFLGIILVLGACSKDDIKTYGGDNYLQFMKVVTDSSVCSFLAYPNDNELEFPVEVEVIGLPSEGEREYKISVDQEKSTATIANYRLPEKFTMKPGKVRDTCQITFIKTAEISTVALRLFLKLKPTADFELGQTECRSAIIYVSNVVAKPNWWTDNVTRSYLGAYSDKKYRLFIQETGKADIDSDNIEELRYYTIIFKHYLQKKKDANEMVREDDGTEMTVALVVG